MRRLLLALLVLLLAMPAAAMPVCAEPAPATATHHMIAADADHDAPAPKHQMPDHGCIGCATPMRLPLAIEDAIPTPALMLRPAPMAALLGDALRPALPPPRLSV